MQLWRPLIVIAFALAAVVGGTLSGASAALARAPVAAIAQDTVCGPAVDPQVGVAFHPCGKMRNGLAIQCHFDAGILVDPAAPVVNDIGATLLSSHRLDLPFADREGPYRPPRAA
jgi:hypothetical protein